MHGKDIINCHQVTKITIFQLQIIFNRGGIKFIAIQTQDKYVEDLKENKLFSHSDKNRKLDEIDIV